jgi:SAM-dependent methyltransferase
MNNQVRHSFGKEYFRNVYRDYEKQNPKRKLLFYKKLVEQALPRDKPARLLDIGCAFGAFLSHANPSWTRLGIDTSEYALREASRRAPGAFFIAADAAYLPTNCAVDAIVTFDSLEHVKNLEFAAAGIKRMLSSRGYFIFVVPVYDGPMGPIIRLLDHDTTHIHKQSREFWLTWAKTHFELCEWQGIFRYLFPAGVYLHVKTKALRRYASAIAVIARKKC